MSSRRTPPHAGDAAAVGASPASVPASQHARAQRHLGREYGNAVRSRNTKERLADLFEEIARTIREDARNEEIQLAAGAASRLMGGDVRTASDSPTEPAPRALISVADLAEILGVDVQTARRWRRAGKLPPAITISGVLRWRAEVVDAWIREREEAAR